MQLPVFEGAPERHSVQRKKALYKTKMTPLNKGRIEQKNMIVREGFERSNWSRRYEHDTYGNAASELEEYTSSKRVTQCKRKPSKIRGNPRQETPVVCAGQAHTNTPATKTAL